MEDKNLNVLPEESGKYLCIINTCIIFKENIFRMMCFDRLIKAKILFSSLKAKYKNFRIATFNFQNYRMTELMIWSWKWLSSFHLMVEFSFYTSIKCRTMNKSIIRIYNLLVQRLYIWEISCYFRRLILSWRFEYVWYVYQICVYVWMHRYIF